MSDMATPTEERPPPPPADPPPPAAGTPPIFGGVAATLADSLGVDALWVRIGFVLLGLAGGLGLVVYGALWLLLVAGPTRGSRGLAVAGGTILVAGLPMLVGGFSLDSPLVLFVVLAGVALALWQPRAEVDAAPPEPRPTVGAPSIPTRAEELRRRVRNPAPRREPSALGAITLGVAMVVAAGIALVDQANGGRLHPEVWHGAAVVVCGVGLLVGAVRGHARWLIVPAVVLAGMGVTSGEMARLGIAAGDATGDRWVWVDATTDGPVSARTGVGSVHVEVDDVPPDPVTVDARVAIGRISIAASDHVAVDVVRPDEPVQRIGRSDGLADVTVKARVGMGRVDVREWTWYGEPDVLDEGPFTGLGDLTVVADLVAMTDDGWFVLADGEAVIDDGNRVALGEIESETDGVTRLLTSYGEFTVLPRGLLLTPYQQVLDLEVLRGRDTAPPADETPPPDTDSTVTEGDQP